MKIHPHRDLLGNYLRQISSENYLYPELKAALDHGDLQTVHKFIDEHDLYYKPKWSEGYFLFCTAIIMKQNEIAKLLLMNCDHIGDDNVAQVPFHLAISQSSDELVQILLEKGADVHFRAEDDDTPLIMAVRANSTSIVRLLLNYHVDVNIPSYRGYTALCIAAENGNSEIINMLLEHGALINHSETESPEYSDQNSWCTFEEAGKKRFPLLLRSKSNDLTSIEKMTALHFAIYWSHLASVELLLDHNADINAGCKVVVEKNYTPLHLAVDTGNIKMVKLLCERGASLDGFEGQILTPLHIAVIKKQSEIVECLLRYGADILHPCRHYRYNGYLPIHLAAVVGSLEVIKILIKYNSDVNCLTPDDLTPLHLAMKKDHGKILKFLVACGADVNAVDIKGRTALHVACEIINVNIIMPLLEYGCNIDTRNKNGRIALSCIGHGIDEFDDNNECKDFNCVDLDDIYLHKPTRRYLSGQIFTIVRKYFIMLETAIFTRRETVRDSYSPNYSNAERNLDDLGIFQMNCQIEINNMKTEKIKNNSISFYKILIKSMDQLTVLLSNNYIAEILKSGKFKEQFPIYGNMIQGHFTKALKRKELLDRSKKFFDIQYKKLPTLPHDCIDNILNFLNNRELSSFINKFKSR